MLLNVGCGDRYAHGWFNVDHEGSPHAKDGVIDITKPLPWEKDSILHVYMGHVLEHVTYTQAKTFLKRLRPLVQKIGQILIVGPDVDVATRFAEEGRLSMPLDMIKFGGKRWPGDEHRWESTVELTIKLLHDTGWSDIQNVGIENVAAFWPVADRNEGWQLAITARS